MTRNADRIAQIAIRQPATVEIFDRAGIDYCCDGSQRLDDECSRLDMPPEEMARTIAEAELESGKHQADWNSSTCEFLILRLLRKEHADIQAQIRDLPTLAAATAERDESRHPELKTIRELVEELTGELTVHMDDEERNVFPILLDVELAYLGELTASSAPREIGSILKKMSEEHRIAGRTLGRLRHESNGFHPPVEADGEYKEFYGRLGSLYSAIRQDLHVENNILFSRVAQMEAALLH
jgi:regulator of cell morphogenesis and NO signaling